jgi:TolB protein
MDLRSGDRFVSEGPRQPTLKPTWSPDGRFIAVTAADWGSEDVYLLSSDGKAHLLLTKNAAAGDREAFDGHPAWSPDGERLAVVSNHEGSYRVYVLTGLEADLDRLLHPVGVATLDAGP